MSLEINSSPPLIIPSPLTDPQQTDAIRQIPVHKHEEEHHAKEMKESKPPDFSKVLDQMFVGNMHKDKHFQKAFNHLANSLEKAFGEAPKVDRETGEEEMRHGGLKRVGKDLTKLFKGLGIPKEMARVFSHGMTDAMKSGEVEQVNFSMSVTRAFNLEVQQMQQGYMANGDGSMIAASMTNSFQLSAVQVRALDISINLSTGEFSMNRTSFDAISMSSSSSASLLSSDAQPAVGDDQADAAATPASEPQSTDPAAAPVDQPAEPMVEEVAADETPPEPTNDFTALLQSNSQLLQISRMIQQSAVMQLKPIAGIEEIATEDDEQAQSGLGVLQDMASRLEEMTNAANNLFESLVQIRNLRFEKEDDEDHLRFTVDALAPIGLSATNEDGRSSTLYPRPDGSLAKVVEDPVQVSV